MEHQNSSRPIRLIRSHRSNSCRQRRFQFCVTVITTVLLSSSLSASSSPSSTSISTSKTSISTMAQQVSSSSSSSSSSSPLRHLTPSNNSTTTAVTSTTIAGLIRNNLKGQYSFLQLACQKALLWPLLDAQPTPQLLTFLGPSDDSLLNFLSLPPYSNYLTNAWMMHLQQVLLFHIIPNHALNATQLLFLSSTTGSISSSSTTTTPSWPTGISGTNLTVQPQDQTLDHYATLVIVNQVASNGYWHVPSQVLLPIMLQVDLYQLVYNASLLSLSSTTSTSSPLNVYSLDTMKTLLNMTQLDILLGTAQGQSSGFTLLATPSVAWESFATQHPDLLSQFLNVSSSSSSSSVHDELTSLLLYHMIPSNFYPSVAFGRSSNSGGNGGSYSELYVTMQNNVSAWFTSTTTTTTATTSNSSSNDSNNSNNSNNNNNNKTTTLIFVNGATILASNIFGNNGLIHVLNQVLVPPDLMEQLTITTEVTNSYSFFQFLSLLDASRINLTNVHQATVFAPLDAAFTTMTNPNITMAITKFSSQTVWIRHLISIVSNHIALDLYPTSYFTQPTILLMKSGYSLPIVTISTNNSNEEVLIEGTTSVVLPDLMATNGVIHGINQLLLPPSVTQTIYQQLVANPSQFSTLLSLLDATNTAHLLNDSQGPMTVFAPTESAFQGLYYTVAELPLLMLSHIIPNTNVFADKLKNNTTLTALSGFEWPVQVENRQTVYIGGAKITLANVLASNGVIQVIDQVLQPPNGTTLAPSTHQPVTLQPSSTPRTTSAPSRRHPRTLLPVNGQVQTPTFPTAPPTMPAPTTTTTIVNNATNITVHSSNAPARSGVLTLWSVAFATIAASVLLLV